jgi:hypothetical protein
MSDDAPKTATAKQLWKLNDLATKLQAQSKPRLLCKVEEVRITLPMSKADAHVAIQTLISKLAA